MLPPIDFLFFVQTSKMCKFNKALDSVDLVAHFKYEMYFLYTMRHIKVKRTQCVSKHSKHPEH